MNTKLKRNDLLYPELCYRIIGCAFEVFNTIGTGHQEKYYQNGLAESFKEKGLSFQKELPFPINFKGKVIGTNRLDFLVDKKIIVELKKGDHFSKTHIEQVVEYLKTTGLSLALLINFGSLSVKYKRIVNLY